MWVVYSHVGERERRLRRGVDRIVSFVLFIICDRYYFCVRKQCDNFHVRNLGNLIGNVEHTRGTQRDDTTYHHRFRRKGTSTTVFQRSNPVNSSSQGYRTKGRWPHCSCRERSSSGSKPLRRSTGLQRVYIVGHVPRVLSIRELQVRGNCCRELEARATIYPRKSSRWAVTVP